MTMTTATTTTTASFKDKSFRPNPLKRVREQYHKTQKEIASKACLKVTTGGAVVGRYEQGLYINPSPSIVSVLVRLPNVELLGSDPHLYPTRNQLIRDYKHWRIEKQEDSAWIFDRPSAIGAIGAIGAVGNEGAVGDFHPFISWRIDMLRRAGVLNPTSRMKFCVLLAVHPAVVLEYEKGNRISMPSVIWTALKNANVADLTIEDLVDSGRAWVKDGREALVV